MTDRNKGRLEALDRLKTLMVKDARSAHEERRYGVSLAVPAHVERAGGKRMMDPALLERLDGVSAGTDMTDGLWPDTPLSKLSLSGGDMVLRYDRRAQALTLATEWRCTRELEEAELQWLKTFTREQWTDGAGEGAEFALPSGFEDARVTFDTDAELQVRTFQVGEVDASKKRLHRKSE